MNPAIWIVSYPRSGSMFVRTLLANYASGLDRPLKLDELTRLCRGEHNDPLWLAITGKPPELISLHDMWNARQTYFEHLRGMTNPELRLIKSHTMVCEMNGLPAFYFTANDKIIHIVRHPCDVAISLSRYSNVEPSDAVNWLVADDLCHRGPPGEFELTGSWAQHTRGWMQNLGLPRFEVIYSELSADPTTVVLNLARYLGLPVDQDRAKRAAAFSNFEQLQADERSCGFIETAQSASDGYFRQGRNDQWQGRLSDKQIGAIRDHAPDLVRHFGFL